MILAYFGSKLTSLIGSLGTGISVNIAYCKKKLAECAWDNWVIVTV